MITDLIRELVIYGKNNGLICEADEVYATNRLLELFDVRVKDQKGKIDTTLYAYLDKYQRSSWMGAVMSAPFKALGWTLSLFKDKPEKKEGKIRQVWYGQNSRSVMRKARRKQPIIITSLVRRRTISGKTVSQKMRNG